MSNASHTPEPYCAGEMIPEHWQDVVIYEVRAIPFALSVDVAAEKVRALITKAVPA